MVVIQCLGCGLHCHDESPRVAMFKSIYVCVTSSSRLLNLYRALSNLQTNSPCSSTSKPWGCVTYSIQVCSLAVKVCQFSMFPSCYIWWRMPSRYSIWRLVELSPDHRGHAIVRTIVLRASPLSCSVVPSAPILVRNTHLVVTANFFPGGRGTSYM